MGGVFIILRHRSEGDFTPLCPWCGQKDSLRHCHWQCAHTAPSRGQLSVDTLEFLEEQPECFTIRGWPTWPDAHDQLRHPLARLPDLSAKTLFDPAPWVGTQFELFTDGTADLPTCPYTRVAAWAVVVNHPDTYSELHLAVQGFVPGIRQTVVGAELWALVAALRFLQATQAFGRIWIDNQEVYLKACRAIQGDLDISPTMADSDLWQAVLTVVPQLACPPVALKVVSHIGRGSYTAAEEFVLRGNAMADAAAASMLDQLPVEVNQAVCAARQAVRRTTKCLAEVQRHFLREREAGPHAQPALSGDEPNMMLLDAPRLSQYLRWHAPPSMSFRGFHFLQAYLDQLTRPDAPIVWMTWHEAFLAFQLRTGVRGYTKSQRGWCLTDPQEPYDFWPNVPCGLDCSKQDVGVGCVGRSGGPARPNPPMRPI